MKQSNLSLTTQQQVTAIIDSHKIEHFGMVRLDRPLSLSIYKEWLKEGLHGDMNYLESHLPIKENPELLLARANSALVFAFHYIPHPKPQGVLQSLNIAKYAQGEDYHDWVKAKLEEIVLDLNLAFQNAEFLVATDSSPVLERDLAHRAGLGWFGKNTCLIQQKRGSFFLIGEILTTLDIADRPTLPVDMCGTCTRCIEACPTKAILDNKKIDARVCISYLTIESKQTPPLELRSAIGDHFFGCDICQDVCPWNSKLFFASTETKNNYDTVDDLRYILTTSAKKLERDLGRTPLMRARSFGLKRNALIVIANLQIKDLATEVSTFTQDPRLGELARWTLAQL